MNDLEERLRSELTELADVLLARPPAESGLALASVGETSDELAHQRLLEPEPSSRLGRWRLVTAAAALAFIAGLAVLLTGIADSDDTVLVQATATQPTSFGAWDEIAPAPITPRPYAVSAWTGSQVTFWAGSNLTRSNAYTDGALYEPETDSWEPMIVPGWGHPGLSGSFFDGEVYALAKGGGTRFDLASGQWSDLAQVEGMFLAATVATDDAVWGLGPAGVNPAGEPDLAIARFDHESNSWDYGPSFEGTPAQVGLVAGLARLESTTVWTGSEIIVWNGTSGGVAFDPLTESWRTVPHPQSPSGLIHRSVAVQTNDGMAVISEVETSSGVAAAVALLREDGWHWRETGIDFSDFASITPAAAGDWLVLFSADQAPVTVHLPSGAWERDIEAPLGGVEAPNTAWTGNELVVWGGVNADDNAPDGARWTPPAN